MPRTTSFLLNNNFTKGLITEATPFNFPQGAVQETFDCIHNITGSIERRLGFDFEINHSVKTISRTNSVIVTYLWKDVAGDGNTSLVVGQIGHVLYFWDGSKVNVLTNNPLSSHPLAAAVDLSAYATAGNPGLDTEECQFASGNGKLFVVHPYCESIAIVYDPNTKTFTVTQITLQMRDFVGQTSDPNGIFFRPVLNYSALPTSHKYNLFNQGWTLDNLTIWDTNRSDMPSNADVMWTFKNAYNHFLYNTADSATDATMPDSLIAIKGNTPAPKGHFILDVCNQDRTAASGLGIAAVTSSYFRPSTVAFFSGRLFFSGINSTGFNSQVYFSQIIERDDQYGSCYQQNDPTAETLFDLLPSDGGVIKIQEAGTIYKLFPVPGGMAVFASNGIWVITGSTGLGFTASDYTIAKVASISALTASSFVDAAGVPLWWNLEGIYKLDATQGGFQVNPITSTTIKTFYDTIPPSEKRNARGFYNPLRYTVQWLYRDTESASFQQYYEYNHVLNIDIRSQAFFVWRLPNPHAVKLHGMVVLENRGGEATLQNVTDNSLVNVTALDSSIVQVWTIGDSIVTPSFKYIVSYNDGSDHFTFAESSDANYYDWFSYDNTGTDFTSTFTTGYLIPNPMTKFQDNYINLYSDFGSKYYVEGLWQFSNTGNSGRWSNTQLVDVTADDRFDTFVTRRKIRGTGEALQIRVNSYPQKPFTIDGWGMFLSSNAMP